MELATLGGRFRRKGRTIMELATPELATPEWAEWAEWADSVRS